MYYFLNIYLAAQNCHIKMNLCYNGDILPKPIPEKVSQIFEKTRVLEFNKDDQCFIFDSDFDKKIVELAMKFYETPKPFTDESLDLFLKNKKELYKLSKILNLPSLQNFTGSHINPESYHQVSTDIEDEIIIFGEQDFNHHYEFRKSKLPTFPTMKYTLKTKISINNEDKFMRLYAKFQSLQNQINELNEEFENQKNHKDHKSSTIESENESESSLLTEDSVSPSKKTKKSARRISSFRKSSINTSRRKKKFTPKVQYEKTVILPPKPVEPLPKLKNPFSDDKLDKVSDLSSSSDSSENTEKQDSLKDQDDITLQMNRYILTTYKNLQFKESQISGSSYAYSSSLNDKCGNVDLLANTDGWFYQSADEEHQYVMFKFDSPILIDYYFFMTYALPKGFAHLKKWRLVTLKEKENNKTTIENIDERETLELDGPNRMCGFHVDYNKPVDNIIIQMVGDNIFQNNRLTLQNIFFASNPPLKYDSPFNFP